MSRILVSGAAGFIGSRIVDMLLGIGHYVIGVDDFSTGRPENIKHHSGNTNFRFYEANITNDEKMRSIFWHQRPDAVCHQAAQASLLKSHKKPAFDAKVNIVGTINLLRLAKVYHCQKFVFASTGAVFNGMQESPYTEATDPMPDRPYGIAKRSAELYIQSFGVPYTIIRYGNVYGPRQVPIGENQLIARLCSHIFKGTPFKVFGDGSHARTFIYVDDIARANLVALHSDITGYVHTYANPVTVRNIVALILDYCGDDFGRVDVGVGDPIPDEPSFVAMDTGRYEWREMWSPLFSLKDGLTRTIDWWRSNNV